MYGWLLCRKAAKGAAAKCTLMAPIAPEQSLIAQQPRLQHQ